MKKSITRKSGLKTKNLTSWNSLIWENKIEKANFSFLILSILKISKRKESGLKLQSEFFATPIILNPTKFLGKLSFKDLTNWNLSLI